MGCCCSVDAEIIRAERCVKNPKDPHNEWAAHMLADIGCDVYAVSRDFPRMQVRLHDPDDNDEEEGTRLPSQPTRSTSSSAKLRHQRIVESIAHIATLCGERDTTGARVLGWMNEALSAKDPEAIASLLEQPDACPVIRKLLVEAELIVPIEMINGNEPTSDAPRSMHAACKTFRVLEYLVQGVVFYPVQRLAFLLWFPWSTRITDVEWNSFVCTRRSFPEHVYVIHRQVSRNYVEKDARCNTPQFEFEWDLVIAVKSSSGDFDDAQIQLRRATILRGKELESSCLCSSVADSQLMKDRVDQLTQRVMDVFHVEVSYDGTGR